MKARFFYFSIIIFLFCDFVIYSQKYIPNFKYNIVSIEYPEIFEDTINNKVEEKIIPLGTGFFIGDSPYFRGNVFLVTAKHVIKHVLNVLDGELILRIPYEDSIKYTQLKNVRLIMNLKKLANKDILFCKDSSYDIAIIRMNDLIPYSSDILDLDVKNIHIGKFVVTSMKRDMDTLRVAMPVIFAGYPCGLSGKFQNYLIYRFGIISALIQDDYETLRKGHILINSEALGGDSGSPVFTFPYSEFSTDEIKLIGILSGSYFTGLTVVEPISEVMKLIEEYLQKN